MLSHCPFLASKLPKGEEPKLGTAVDLLVPRPFNGARPNPNPNPDPNGNPNPYLNPYPNPSPNPNPVPNPSPNPSQARARRCR